MLGFLIWSVTCLALAGFGIYCLLAKEAVSLWAGAAPPKVKDVKKYNRAVAILWFVYAALFEVFGIPLLFLKQNSAGFVPVILGTVAATIGMMVAYVMIEKKYRI